jgi:nitrogen fixation NifU-like protein
MMYSEQVMDHFANPHNVGELDGANAVGEVGNARCGDIMRMYLKIEDGVIKDATFKTFGCCAAIASSSVTTDLIKGMTVDEALNFKNAAVVDALGGLPPAKIHCSVLAEEAIKKAIDNYKEGQEKA